jgi:hypothetical protein
VLHRSVDTLLLGWEEVEVAGIGRAAMVNGILNGTITEWKEGGGDYSQLKRGQSY